MHKDFAKIFALAHTCSNLKFPLTFGFSSGETEIFSIDHDSNTESLYMAGVTTSTQLKSSGATKSVFVSMYNGCEYTWIRAIEEIDTVESMSAMGSSSPYLILYATKSSLPYIPQILTISKTDGSIVRGVSINIAALGDVIPNSK